MSARAERAGSPQRTLALARAAGLLASTSGSTWQKGLCPTGCDSGDRRQAATGYHVDGGWHCHRCGAHGGEHAWFRARRESAESYAHVRADDRPAYVARPRLNVPLAWLDLWCARDAWIDQLVGWARDARGWPEDLARAVAEHPHASFAPDASAFPRLAADARKLVALAHGARRPVLVAIYDATGVMRSAERRWVVPDGGRKCLALTSREVGNASTWPGGVRVLGEVPTAVAAARRGERLLLVEGTADYLAAAGLCRLARSGAVIGALSAGEVPRVARALADALETADLTPEVVLVPHLGDKNRAGERAMDAAGAALRGRAAVRLALVPVDEHGKGDLADCARLGIDRLRQVLDDALELHPAPTSLGDLRARLPALVEATVEGIAPDELVVLEVTPGVGKSHATLQVTSRLAAAGQRPWIAWRTAREVWEKLDELTGMRARGEVPAVPVDVRVGRLREDSCEVYALADPEQRERVSRLVATAPRGMQSLCGYGDQLCALASTCPGYARRGDPAPGSVVLSTHALLYRSATPDNCDLAVLDDAEPRLEVETVTRADLRSLLTSPRAARWREVYPSAEQAVRDLLAALDDLAQPGPEGRAHPERRPLASLDLAFAEALLREALTVPPPPAPPPSAARDNGGSTWPDPAAWPTLRRLAEHAARDQLERPEGEPDPHVDVRLDPDGAWAIEVRRPVLLPRGVPVLLLDATPGPELEVWARLNGRRLRYVRADAPMSPHVELRHVETKILAGPATRDEHGWIYRRTEGAIRRALVEAVADLGRCHLGLIGFKAVADALRGEGPAGCETAARLAQLVETIRAGGYQITVGHYGADDRGVNRFRGANEHGPVRALVLLGDPRENLGTCEADVAAWRAWGVGDELEAGEVYAARTRVRAVQLLHRAGLVDRDAPVRVIYIGTDPPDLGRPWQTRRLSRGPAPQLSHLDALEALRQHAAQHGAASEVWLRDAHGLSARPARRLLAALQSETGWRYRSAKRTDEHGRAVARFNVLAPDEGSAARYAASIGQILNDPAGLSEFPVCAPAPAPSPARGPSPEVRSAEVRSLPDARLSPSRPREPEKAPEPLRKREHGPTAVAAAG